MTNQERMVARFKEGVQDMNVDERDALKAALKATQAIGHPIVRRDVLEHIIAIPAAHARSKRRQESDSATDRRRRKLVGARMPIALAEQCRQCANRTGVSLYQWTYQALVQAIADTP